MGAAWLGPCDPEVHRGIRSPRSPGFGNSQKVCGTDRETLVTNGMSEFMIPKRKCVRFSKGPHCDVMRLTLSYPTNSAHP